MKILKPTTNRSQNVGKKGYGASLEWDSGDQRQANVIIPTAINPGYLKYLIEVIGNDPNGEYLHITGENNGLMWLAGEQDAR